MARQSDREEGIISHTWYLVAGLILLVGCSLPEEQIKDVVVPIVKALPARRIDEGDVSRDLLFVMFELGQLAGTLLIVLYIVKRWRGGIHDRRGSNPSGT